MSTLGERVKACRKELKLTQAQLAKAAHVSQQTIQQIENDTTSNTRHIVSLANGLKVNPIWLEKGTGTREIYSFNNVLDLTCLPESEQNMMRKIISDISEGRVNSKQFFAVYNAMIEHMPHQ